MIQLGIDNRVEDFTFILSLRDHTHLGQIRNIDPESVSCNLNMNAAHEINFTVYKYNHFEMGKIAETDIGVEPSDLFDLDLDKFIEPLWDSISDFKFIYVKELDEYFEITIDQTDDENLYKTIVGTSACEVELSQCYLYDFEINTELDMARVDYDEKYPTLFYREDRPESSLLHRVLYKLPQYSIAHVDESLARLTRVLTFSVDGQDVYSFLTGDVAQEVDCLFVFDSVNRTISAYDLKTICVDCGHRGDFNDYCPECYSENLKYYGNDTGIFVDTENLVESITVKYDYENVKNCFKLEAGDDDMTAAVVNLNPNGTDYLYYFSPEQKWDMPYQLTSKLSSYDYLIRRYTPEYTKLTEEMYEAIDKIVYYTSGMMPTQKDDPTNAALEAAKLTEEEMSPMGVTEVAPHTSTATINTAMKNYAKVFVKSGYFKIEVNQGQFDYEGIDENGLHYGYWKGNFKITNYSDEEDVATSELINVKVCNDFETYMVQKIKKKLALDSEEEGSIFDVLSIEDLDKFKEALTLYGLNRLRSFYDSIEGCIDIMIEMDQGHENSDVYDSLYQPYYQKLKACQSEMNVRQNTISEWNVKYNQVTSRRKEIQKILNFEDYLGADLYKVFCMFRREDKYSNSNYVSTGLENDALFERAKAFFEAAQEEIIKAGTPQCNITADLLNLWAIKEYEPIKEQLQLGNFIRTRVDGADFKLRLINIQISFGDIQNLQVEFSNVTRKRDIIADTKQILDSAQSMASSYGFVEHQVRESKKETDRMNGWVSAGLDATEVKIVNSADSQDIIFKDSGLLVRRKDEFTEEYDGCQLKLLNNGLYITKNDWSSVEAALGKFYMVDPVSGETIMQFGLNAKTIVGELIVGQQLTLYSKDNTKEMYFGNEGLILNAKDDGSGIYQRIFDIQKNGESQMYIDADGNLVFANPQTIETNNSLELVSSSVAGLTNRADSTDIEIDGINENIAVIDQDIIDIKADIASLQGDTVDLQNNVSDIDKSVDNIMNVLSGNKGTSPLEKVTLNAENTSIANGLITNNMVASGITASKITFADEGGNKTVQATLESHRDDIKLLKEDTTVSNEDGTSSSLKDKYIELLGVVQLLQTEIETLKAEIEAMKN